MNYFMISFTLSPTSSRLCELLSCAAVYSYFTPYVVCFGFSSSDDSSLLLGSSTQSGINIGDWIYLSNRTSFLSKLWLRPSVLISAFSMLSRWSESFSFGFGGDGFMCLSRYKMSITVSYRECERSQSNYIPLCLSRSLHSRNTRQDHDFLVWGLKRVLNSVQR